MMLAMVSLDDRLGCTYNITYLIYPCCFFFLLVSQPIAKQENVNKKQWSLKIPSSGWVNTTHCTTVWNWVNSFLWEVRLFYWVWYSKRLIGRMQFLSSETQMFFLTVFVLWWWQISAEQHFRNVVSELKEKFLMLKFIVSFQ